MTTRLRERIGKRLATWARPRQPENLPVRVDRRRVYVLPTRFGLFFAVLLGAMLLGALNYNNNPALLLALLLGSAGLASLVFAHLQLSGLHITDIAAEPVPAGELLQLRLAVSTHDQRPRRGLGLRAGPQASVISPFHGEGIAALGIPTTRRGMLPAPRLRIGTTQPLGLAEAWSWVWPEASLLVYPRPEPASPALPEGEGSSAQPRLNPNGEDVHHLRTYRAGDALHAIAWKASARRDSLMVREHERPAGHEILLDFASLAFLPYEARICRLAAWVERAERENRRYRLQLPGQPAIGPAHGPAHRHACLRALALMPVSENRS